MFAMTNKFLITIPFGSDIGYAISPLVQTFFRVAAEVCGNENDVHVAYAALTPGKRERMLSEPSNVLEFNPARATNESLSQISDYVKRHGIGVVFGLDLSVCRPYYRTLREAGVEKIISYLGTPMGTIKSGWKLWLKRAQFRLIRQRPDHFIFESRAMQDTAVYGAGIPAAMTSVVHLGVDTARFCPSS
jgi:hypothetical protein